jgi:hypothetical protein
MGTSNAATVSSNAAIAISMAMVVATNVTPTSGPVSQRSASVGSLIRCYVEEQPSDSVAIPTLSQWAILLLAGVLGLWGAVLISRGSVPRR